MLPLIHEHRAEVVRLCDEFRVVRLGLFGSAVTGPFHPETSDLDFEVEFGPMSPEEHANAYLGLLEQLQRLFQRRIDLLESEAIKNPYLRKEISQTREILYAA